MTTGEDHFCYCLLFFWHRYRTGRQGGRDKVLQQILTDAGNLGMVRKDRRQIWEMLAKRKQRPQRKQEKMREDEWMKKKETVQLLLQQHTYTHRCSCVSVTGNMSLWNYRRFKRWHVSSQWAITQIDHTRCSDSAQLYQTIGLWSAMTGWGKSGQK